MYYIPEFTNTDKGININNRVLVDEQSNEICKFVHGTEKGYFSKKPLFVDFEYTVNSYNELEISDEVAETLIAKYKGLKFKTFQTQASRMRSHNMTGLMAWASVMGDR